MCQYCAYNISVVKTFSTQKMRETAYTFIKVLDPHISDNPMFSMSSLPEKSEAHLLPDETCELWTGGLASN